MLGAVKRGSQVPPTRAFALLARDGQNEKNRPSPICPATIFFHVQGRGATKSPLDIFLSQVRLEDLSTVTPDPSLFARAKNTPGSVTIDCSISHSWHDSPMPLPALVSRPSGRPCFTRRPFLQPCYARRRVGLYVRHRVSRHWHAAHRRMRPRAACMDITRTRRVD